MHTIIHQILVNSAGDIHVQVIIHNGHTFTLCEDVFQLAQMTENVRKNGYNEDTSDLSLTITG